MIFNFFGTSIGSKIINEFENKLNEEQTVDNEVETIKIEETINNQSQETETAMIGVTEIYEQQV